MSLGVMGIFNCLFDFDLTLVMNREDQKGQS